MSDESVLIKTVQELNAALIIAKKLNKRVKYLESDEHINNLKADAIEDFVYFVVESGELSGSDNKFMWDFAKELRNK